MLTLVTPYWVVVWQAEDGRGGLLKDEECGKVAAARMRLEVERDKQALLGRLKSMVPRPLRLCHAVGSESCQDLAPTTQSMDGLVFLQGWVRWLTKPALRQICVRRDTARDPRGRLC